MAEREKKSVARWSPFDDDFGWFPVFGRPHRDLLESVWGRGEGGKALPAVDVTEDDKQYVVTAELPGTKREDVTVEVADRVLTIRGEKKSEREEKNEKRRYVERSYGSYSRAFTLPADAGDDRIQAAFKDGVLTVTIEKVADKKSRTVDVKSA